MQGSASGGGWGKRGRQEQQWRGTIPAYKQPSKDKDKGKGKGKDKKQDNRGGKRELWDP